MTTRQKWLTWHALFSSIILAMWVSYVLSTEGNKAWEIFIYDPAQMSLRKNKTWLPTRAAKRARAGDWLEPISHFILIRAKAWCWDRAGEAAAEDPHLSTLFPTGPKSIFSELRAQSVKNTLSLGILLVCTDKITWTAHSFTLSTYCPNDHILVLRVMRKNYFHWVLLCSQNK